MARHVGTSFPPYPRKPHASGQARIRLAGQSTYLGPHGSPESYGEYERLLGQWRRGRAEGAAIGTARPGEIRTVQTLVAHWDIEMERRYAGQAHHAAEKYHYRQVLGVVLGLYGPRPVQDFGTVALKTVRKQLVAMGWCRNHVNRATTRIKTMFRWALGDELLPSGGLYADLWAVKALEEGEDGVAETEAVPPADEASIAAVLGELAPMPRALLELLLLTGARPSELFRLRPEDLHRDGSVEVSRGYRVKLPANVWAVRLKRHKTAGKGKLRFLVFGPRAQTLLAPLLADCPAGELIFTPAKAVALWHAEQRRRRKSKVQPSQHDRGKARPKRQPGEVFTTGALNQAVGRALDRLNRKAAAEGLPPVSRFHVYQLRHNAAANLIDEFGEETARAVLGHAAVDMTRKYALRDVKTAAAAMGKAG